MKQKQENNTNNNEVEYNQKKNEYLVEKIVNIEMENKRLAELINQNSRVLNDLLNSVYDEEQSANTEQVNPLPNEEKKDNNTN
ncbi:MAG: hypothetical protein R6U15_01000 [Candidatus Izemoplasmatales bacterium]